MTTIADPNEELTPAITPTPTERHIELAEHSSAHNYHPLPVVVAEADGAWVTDVEGKRYLDMVAAYSALNFGHRHPDLIAAAHAQLDRVTLTSRAFHNDQMGRFCEGLAELCGMQMVLPMNSGAEAVETAVKTARRWGYDVKGVPEDRAKIVTCEGNFHGRTITIVSFSTDPLAKTGFGPFTPGFETVPYGDVQALEIALADPDVVAFLVEPIQGEAGVIVPPEGYLRRARELCDANRVLLVADEIQSGLGRTGRTFACEHEDVRPDVYVVGKALGGGIVPLSAVVSTREVLGLFRPGEHGSTFGGNPLACAIGLEVLRLIGTGEYQRRSEELGTALIARLRAEAPPAVVTEVRGKGLWIGIELAPDVGPGRAVCERLMDMGVLAKDTQESTVRLAPPLCVSQEDLDWAAERILMALAERLD
ncbi:MAG TPA: ornithine--oxo-acid transaminase [Actinomycetota bacterium]|jgi:ornithine--oxo-acid transaminase|nr:ornithine--oxo-acid transaminase [Actinomycetota bacterium]